MKEYKNMQDAYSDGYEDGLNHGLTMKDDEIGAGGAAIIVCDDTLINFDDSSFKQYLDSEGFEKWKKGHSFNTSWIYVNINSKFYAKGMPGIGVTSHLGEHAITIDEFKTIYNIFKQYKGLSLICMTKKEQQEHEKMLNEYK